MNTGEAEQHLTDAAVEALAHGRAELTDPAARAHAGVCALCAGRVAEATALSHTARAALRRAATAEVDLDALVGAALAAVAAPASLPPSTAATPAQSAAAPSSAPMTPPRRPLALAAALAFAALVPLGAAAWFVVGVRGVSVFSVARDLVALGAGVLRLIHLAFPGGSAAASAAGLLLVCAIGLALKRLIDGAAGPHGKVQEAST